MSWIDPGFEILERVRKPWATSTIVGDKDVRKRAHKQRKAVRERLWDLKNPGKRKSYDKNLLGRVAAWRKANPEKVRQYNQTYAKSEHGKEMIRAKTARYRARKKLRVSAA